MIVRLTVLLALIAGLSACGGEKSLNAPCDEPQRYQAVTQGKRVEPAEGLDPLNEFAEMPIPRAEGAPERLPGSRCIELPPYIQTGS